MKKKELKAIVSKLREEQVPKQHQKKLKKWLDIFRTVIEQRGYKQHTINNHNALLAHIHELWGDIRMHQLKPHDILNALKPMIEEKPGTAQRVIRELHDVYQEAIANGWASTNPVTHVKGPKVKVQRSRLSLEEYLKVREHVKDNGPIWAESLVLLALITGQRRGDLIKMKFSDIHDGHLHVEQQKQAGKGYGARIAIPLELRLDAIGMTLGDVVELCKWYGKTAVKADSPLIRKTTGGPVGDSASSLAFSDAMRAVLPPDSYETNQWPSLHECRSLSARLYKLQGIDTQTLLGHKHAEMTAMYENDRGLSANEWKTLVLPKVDPKDSRA